MKFPSTLEAGLKSGILTEAKYVKGSYIVFSTADEMYKFTERYGNKNKNNLCGCTDKENVLIKGTKCYLLENEGSIQGWKAQTEYRWSGTEWEELPNSFFDVPNDGILYGRRNGKWYAIKIDEDAIDKINATLEDHQEQINSKQPELISGENIKTFYDQSILGPGNLITPIATKMQVGGITSGTSPQEEGSINYEVEINQSTGIGSINIPPLTSTTNPEELIKILEGDDGLCLDGGNAED